MQLSQDQFASLREQRVQALAQRWQGAIDRGLPAPERSDPHARLKAMAAMVLEALPATARLAAADVQQAARGLDLALAAGTPWREARAAALLNAAAALGAEWHVDQRLLGAAERATPAEGDDEATAWSAFFSAAQGQRFQTAARRECHLRPGLRTALMPLLGPDDPSPQRMQPLLRAAFSPASADADKDEDEDAVPVEAPAHVDHPALPPGVREEAQAFVATARARLAQAGIVEPNTALLGVAVDLAFGLGRGARWFSQAPAGLEPTGQQAWIKEKLRDLAGFQP